MGSWTCDYELDGKDTDGTKWYRCIVHDELAPSEDAPCAGYSERFEDKDTICDWLRTLNMPDWIVSALYNYHSEDDLREFAEWLDEEIENGAFVK